MSKHDRYLHVEAEITAANGTKTALLLPLLGHRQATGNQPYFEVPGDPDGEFYFWPKATKGWVHYRPSSRVKYRKLRAKGVTRENESEHTEATQPPRQEPRQDRENPARTTTAD